jgi:hypothetical protein
MPPAGQVQGYLIDADQQEGNEHAANQPVAIPLLENCMEMCHKVRVALMEEIEKRGGIVDAGETFVGGLGTSRHWDKHGGGGTGGVGSRKTPIAGAGSGKGNDCHLRIVLDGEAFAVFLQLVRQFGRRPPHLFRRVALWRLNFSRLIDCTDLKVWNRTNPVMGSVPP